MNLMRGYSVENGSHMVDSQIGARAEPEQSILVTNCYTLLLAYLQAHRYSVVMQGRKGDPANRVKRGTR